MKFCIIYAILKVKIVRKNNKEEGINKMPRITSKGQVTIPKKIRDAFNIKPSNIGEFIVRENEIIFKVKKGTILDAHTEKTNKKIDFKKIREVMEKDIANNVIKEME